MPLCNLINSYFHKLMKDSLWVGSLKIILLMLLFKEGLTPKLERVSQGCVQPSFENAQGQELHNLCATC